MTGKGCEGCRTAELEARLRFLSMNDGRRDKVIMRNQWAARPCLSLCGKIVAALDGMCVIWPGILAWLLNADGWSWGKLNALGRSWWHVIRGLKGSIKTLNKYVIFLSKKAKT